LERVVQTGAQPITWVPLAVELQRDWACEETSNAVAVFTVETMFSSSRSRSIDRTPAN
jgi:hypothetical protein